MALFVGALLGYAAARAIDAMGWRVQRQAAARLARAEVRRLRGLLGPAGAPGDPAAGGAVLELLAAASGLPVRLHSAVERKVKRKELGRFRLLPRQRKGSMLLDLLG